jgi:hypothetical protein
MGPVRALREAARLVWDERGPVLRTTAALVFPVYLVWAVVPTSQLNATSPLLPPFPLTMLAWLEVLPVPVAVAGTLLGAASTGTAVVLITRRVARPLTGSAPAQGRLPAAVTAFVLVHGMLLGAVLLVAAAGIAGAGFLLGEQGSPGDTAGLGVLLLTPLAAGAVALLGFTLLIATVPAVVLEGRGVIGAHLSAPRRVTV